MELGVRIILNFEMLVFTLPLHFLRWRIFRHELRFSQLTFWLGYALVLAFKIVVFNLALERHGIPGWVSRNEFYLWNMLAFNVWFFIAIRPLWPHIFVLGIFFMAAFVYLMIPIYGCGLVFGADPILNHLAIALTGLLLFVLTFRRLEKWLTECLMVFTLDERPRFWRIFCLMPLCFLLSGIILTLDTTHDGGYSFSALMAPILGLLGLFVALRFIRRQMIIMRASHILGDNPALAAASSDLRLQKLGRIGDRERRLRRIRHNFRHFNLSVSHHLRQGDFPALAEDCRICRQELTAFDEAEEPRSGKMA